MLYEEEPEGTDELGLREGDAAPYEKEEEPNDAGESGLLEGFVVPKEEAPEGSDELVPLEEGAVEKEGVDELPSPYPPVAEPVALESGELESGEPEPVKPDPVAPEPVKPDPPVVAEEGVAGLEGVNGTDGLEAGFEHAPRAKAEATTKGRANNLSFIFVLSLRVKQRVKRAKTTCPVILSTPKMDTVRLKKQAFSCQRQKSV